MVPPPPPLVPLGLPGVPVQPERTVTLPKSNTAAYLPIFTIPTALRGMLGLIEFTLYRAGELGVGAQSVTVKSGMRRAGKAGSPRVAARSHDGKLLSHASHDFQRADQIVALVGSGN